MEREGFSIEVSSCPKCEKCLGKEGSLQKGMVYAKETACLKIQGMAHCETESPVAGARVGTCARVSQEMTISLKRNKDKGT